MINDEDLQQQAESGTGGNDTDARAYRAVFSAVNKEPGYQLPMGFESRVVERLVRVNSRRRYSDVAWLAAGLAALVVVLIVAASVTAFKPGIGQYVFVETHWKLFAFGIGLILMFSVLDRKLLRRNVSS